MSQQLENKVSQQDRRDDEQDEIRLLDLLIILVRHKWLVIATPFLIGTLSLIASLLMTPIFTSTVTIMSPQQESSGMAAILGQLGGLTGAASGIPRIKNSNDLYIGMLGSRTIGDRLIERFDLQAKYGSKIMEDARKALAGASRFGSGKKDGLISISVSDKDPKFAAELANAYVAELIKLTQTMAISEASQRRLFFERQLKETKDQLANAEIALRTTQEKTGMIQPEGQVQAILSSIAQLRGMIAAKEVQLNAMRTFATGQNPELLRTQEELRGLQAQLGKLEKNRPSKDGEFMVPSRRIPEVGVEYVRSLRDVKYYETIFELLAKQYELARIDEAKDSSVIQVLDVAIPSERKSKPRRATFALAGLLLGCVLGVLLAFASEFYKRSRNSPGGKNNWQALSAAWKGN